MIYFLMAILICLLGLGLEIGFGMESRIRLEARGRVYAEDLSEI